MDSQYMLLAYKYRTLKDRLDALEAMVEQIDFGGIKPFDPSDPAPVDWARLGMTRAASPAAMAGRLSPVADPPPEDFYNVRVMDLLRRWGGGNVDPSPEDLGHITIKDLYTRIYKPWPKIPQWADPAPEDFRRPWADPSPEDLKRLDLVELESMATNLKDSQVRLSSMERLVDERMEELGKAGK